MGFVSEFIGFMDKHKVVGLAVAFIMGAAANKLVSALVQDIIMPVVGAMTPGGDWRSAVFYVGPVRLLVGDFAGALVDFVIISLVVFLIVKYAAKSTQA
ncbi:MscL family protein [Candidatus Parvarchaeota archaeon]|nr:MscL family protein [Candidatus Parvarchaeota archaeon]